jgi:tetratricopeptide (TPR) repeat protein
VCLEEDTVQSSIVCLLIACVAAGFAQTADPRSLAAQQMIRDGNFSEAVTKLREVYDDVKQGGKEDTQLSEAASELAGGYIFLDRYAEAEPLLNESIRIDHVLFGEDSLNACRHSVVLAKLYIAQGKVHEAERLLLWARPILERGYGPESPQMAALLNQLGLANDMLDRLPQAAVMYRQAIAIYEKQSPKHRSLISIVISNLVAVLIDTGQYDEALRLARKSVAIVEQVYGPDHPYVARALHNLGTALQAQKKMDEAKPLYERALAIWVKHPGVGTLDAATAESSLAAVYMDQGYYNKAESLLVKAVATREKFLGSSSPDLASALNNLGVLYAHENRLTEARKTLERGLTIADSLIGRTHPRTVPLVANLGWVYYTEGRYHRESYLKSEEMYRRLLALQEQRFGPDRVEVSDALASLAEVCAVQKNYREAKRLEERALAIRRVVLGPEHPDTVKTLKQYTFLLRKSKD